MDYPPLSSSPLQLTPSLVESQIQRIADTAENMIKAMANVEPKALKNNKKVSKEVEVIIYYFLLNYLFRLFRKTFDKIWVFWCVAIWATFGLFWSLFGSWL